MIEFKQLIHKTGKVILYKDWKKAFETNSLIVFQGELEGSTWSYDPKEILLSDDFKVIYEEVKSISNVEENLKRLQIMCTCSETLAMILLANKVSFQDKESKDVFVQTIKLMNDVKNDIYKKK